MSGSSRFSPADSRRLSQRYRDRSLVPPRATTPPPIVTWRVESGQIQALARGGVRAHVAPVGGLLAYPHMDLERFTPHIRFAHSNCGQTTPIIRLITTVGAMRSPDSDEPSSRDSTNAAAHRRAVLWNWVNGGHSKSTSRRGVPPSLQILDDGVYVLLGLFVELRRVVTFEDAQQLPLGVRREIRASRCPPSPGAGPDSSGSGRTTRRRKVVRGWRCLRKSPPGPTSAITSSARVSSLTSMPLTDASPER